MAITKSGGVMLLTKKLEAQPVGGRQLLCRLNRDALADIYGDRFATVELQAAPMRGVGLLAEAFRGHIDGLNRQTIAAALEQVRADNIQTIFVDGSNLGAFAKIVKARLPDVHVCTFFHNVEARFFLGALRTSRTPRALGVLIANYLAEKKSVTFSDKIIALSESNSRLLRRLYGRPATHVSPMAVRDKLDRQVPERSPQPFALFVGGAFYANREGVRWFAKHVVPRIRLRTCVVGKGFEALKRELETAGNVEVIGEVENLAEWYGKALFVIAPIFDGSGMKTKVAEALMFGKRIVGTPEAFSGYEDTAGRAGWVCSSADDFVSAIEDAAQNITMAFDPRMRAIYEAFYSYQAHRARLQAILSTPPARV